MTKKVIFLMKKIQIKTLCISKLKKKRYVFSKRQKKCVFTWMPGGVPHVHERGECLGGVGDNAPDLPAHTSALRQRVL